MADEIFTQLQKDIGHQQKELKRIESKFDANFAQLRLEIQQMGIDMRNMFKQLMVKMDQKNIAVMESVVEEPKFKVIFSAPVDKLEDSRKEMKMFNDSEVANPKSDLITLKQTETDTVEECYEKGAGIVVMDNTIFQTISKPFVAEYRAEFVVDFFEKFEGVYWVFVNNIVAMNDPYGFRLLVMERILDIIQSMPHDAHIRGVLVSVMSAISTFYPNTNSALRGQDNYQPKLVNDKQMTCILGMNSTISAAYPDLDSLTSFFGVYDNHGSKAVAKFCAKYLYQQVLKHEAYSAGEIGTSVHKSFLRMDEMMRGQRGWRELAVLGDKIDKVSGLIEGLIWSPRGGDANNHFDDWPHEEGPHSDFHGPTSRCTACVVVIQNKQLVIANAGDFRCVISRRGQAYNLSKDHKPDLEVKKDKILKAGGFIQVGRVNGSLNLARAIGDVEFKRNKTLLAERQIVIANPDINTIELCDNDEFLVLACDGIWDCMSSQQLVNYVREQLNSETKLSAICERVFDRCLAPTIGGEGCDNMTMILVQFKKPVGSGAFIQVLKPKDIFITEKEKSSDGNQPASTLSLDGRIVFHIQLGRICSIHLICSTSFMVFILEDKDVLKGGVLI